MLGLLHQAATREGLVHFTDYFKRHPGSVKLIDPLVDRSASRLIRRSIWGLIRVYNTLGGTLQCTTVRGFQMHVQERAKAIVA